MSEWDEITNKLEPISWDEIKEFYKRNFNEIVQDDWKEAFCFAWSKSRKMAVIDLLVTGYKAAQHQAKVDFAAKYDHKSPLQVIAAEYVKRRGTTGALALLEENRFIDGYEAGLHASNHQWISVKDKLPDYDQLVLLWHPNFKRQFVGCRVDSGIMEPLYWWQLELDMHEPEGIILHWMPLPEAPKE